MKTIRQGEDILYGIFGSAELWKALIVRQSNRSHSKLRFNSQNTISSWRIQPGHQRAISREDIGIKGSSANRYSLRPRRASVDISFATEIERIKLILVVFVTK